MCQAKHSNGYGWVLWNFTFPRRGKTNLKHLLVLGAEALLLSTPYLYMANAIVPLLPHRKEKTPHGYRIYPGSLHSQTVKLNRLLYLPPFHTTLETEWTSKCVSKAFYLVSIMPRANSGKVRNASWSRCIIWVAQAGLATCLLSQFQMKMPVSIE